MKPPDKLTNLIRTELRKDGSGYRQRINVYHYRRPYHPHFGFKIAYLDLDKELHREYGPAEIYNYDVPLSRFDDGMECPHRQLSWYQHGKLHRLNGPAIVIEKPYTCLPPVDKSYYIEGHFIAGSDTELEKFREYCRLPLDVRVQLKLIM